MGGGHTYTFSTGGGSSYQFGTPESIFEKFTRMGGFEGLDLNFLGEGLASGSPLGGGRPSSYPGPRFGGGNGGPNGRSKPPESTVSEKRIGLTLEE